MATQQTAFQQDELRRALAAAGVGVWIWDLAQASVRWSPEVYALFGLAPGEFDGTYEGFLSAIDVPDRAATDAAVRQAVAEKSDAYRVTFRAAKPTPERWIEARGQALLSPTGDVTGMAGIVVDVTAQVQALRAYEQSESRQQLFSESLSDYVYEAEFDGQRVTEQTITGNFERATGMTVEQLEARGGWLNVMHPDDLENMPHLMSQLARGLPVRHEYRVLGADGSFRWLRDHIKPLLDPKSGALVGFKGGAQNITEHRALQEQLVQAQKMEALARLAGGVAHDFNNLLTVAMTSVELLRQARNTEETRAEALSHLDTALERSAELTRSLLTFGRTQPTQSQVVVLSDYLKSATSILRRTMGERVEVKLRIEKDAAALNAIVDPGQLQLVLLNLGINGRDAMAGGGTLTLGLRREVSTAADAKRPAELSPGTFCVVSVQDTGSGIAARDLPHIFEPYFTTKAPGKGTGLGLAISHSIVRKLGGGLRVESSPGAGSTFHLYFPVTEQAPQAVAALPTRTAVGGTERVLLVEDNANVRQMTARTLEDLGYAVRAVESPAEALALSDDELRAIPLLLSDVSLPGMDGVELGKQVKQRNPNCVVLLMSGFVPDGTDVGTNGVGQFAFLPKPFTAEGLGQRVRETLDARRTAAT